MAVAPSCFRSVALAPGGHENKQVILYSGRAERGVPVFRGAGWSRAVIGEATGPHRADRRTLREGGGTSAVTLSALPARLASSEQ